MQFEEAHNNLRAIRLLYRLLEDNSLSLQNLNSEDLVERARLLLKSLLDVAVESVFETHLKIIKTQAGICKPSCTFEQEQPVARMQSKSPMATNSSQSYVKYPTCSKINSQMDEQPQLKLLAKKAVPGLSKFSNSSKGGTNSKRWCSVGEENSMMQHNSFKATNLPNKKYILHSTENSHQEQQHAKELLQIFEAKAGGSKKDNNKPLLNTVHEVQSNSSAARQVASLDQKDDFFNDVVNAIKGIESRILALQLCPNMVDSTKNSAGHHIMPKVAKLDSPVTERKAGTAGSQLGRGRSLLEGNQLMNHQAGQTSCKSENSISANAFEQPLLTRNESLNQVAYHNHRLQTTEESANSIDIPRQIGTQLVSGGEELRSQNRIGPSAQNMAMLDGVHSLNRLISDNVHLGSQANECIQGLRVPLNQDGLPRRPSMLNGRTNKKCFVRKNPVAWSETEQNWKVRREKPPRHQMVTRPTLLDQRSSEIKVFPHLHRDRSVWERGRTHNTSHVEPWRTRVRLQRHEMEESSSNSGSSPSWTSQQGSANSSSHSEDYSSPSGTLGPTSGRMNDAEYEGSSEESSNSYPYEYEGPSHREESLKSYISHGRRNPERTIGRLKRLKNKLGLIFHHHHHHHHYHHENANDSNHSKVGHRHSMWNHLQKIFHHKNKHGLPTKRKVEKTRRGAVVPHRNQVGQFHRLVEGFLKHIRHSKKQKPSKLGVVKGSRYSPHSHGQKKLHWYQMLRRRRGVKLKNKGRVKVGFISQKSLKN